GAERAGRPARVAAHHLRLGGRPGCAGDPPGPAGRVAGDRAERPAGRGPGTGAGRVAGRGEPDAVRAAARAVAALPADPAGRPGPAVHTTNGALTEFSLPADTTRRLREIARTGNATLFMVLTAACQLLLSRWSGQSDIATGTVVSGRERAELDGLIGFFVNTI